MVAYFTMRTHGVNQAFHFVEGIWLHRKSRQIRFIFRKRPILNNTCPTCSELPSYISTMGISVGSGLCFCEKLGSDPYLAPAVGSFFSLRSFSYHGRLKGRNPYNNLLRKKNL